MRVALCYPPIPSPKGVPLLSQNRQFQWFSHPTAIYPVVPASAATLLRTRGHEVLWLDGIARGMTPEAFWEALCTWAPEAVFLETKTPVVRFHWAWVRELKQRLPQVKVVMGGDHVTALPEETLRAAPVDAVLRGGDYDFALLSWVEGREAPVELAALPPIDRELTRWRDYAFRNGNFARTPGAYIMSARDCWHGKCTFCSWTTLYPTYRVRPVGQVLDEVGALIALGAREIMDDAGSLPVGPWLKEFCEGMIARGYHRRVRISGMDAYALSLVKLGCGNNLIGYYMYHGGTNPIGRDSTLQESRATGYPNDYPILNYDFATALSQYGETRPQYRWLNLLHLLAADFGRELARMEYVSSLTHPTPEDRQTLRCCLRTDGTAGFVFVNHHQRHAALCPVSDVVLDTGTVCFPPITVAGDLAFLFPFGLSLGGRTLRWATAQPICRSGDTWFFAAIPGIPARYRFADGTLVTAGQGIAVQTAGPVRLVTLPLGQALWLRRLGQRIVLGQGCDLYEEDGTIRAVQPGSFRYLLWQDDHFVPREETRSFTPAQLTMTPCPEPFAPPYEEELCLGGRVPRHWYRLEVSGSEGFLRFPQRCDVAQIYADGALAADNFYNGEPWRVPASLLYGRQCYLVMTPPSDAVFMDP